MSNELQEDVVHDVLTGTFQADERLGSFAGRYDETVILTKPVASHAEPVRLIVVDECGVAANAQDAVLTTEAAIHLAQRLIEGCGYEARLALPEEITPAQLHGATENDEREGWNLDALTAAVAYGRIAEFSYEKAQSPRTLERRVLKPERIFTTAGGKLCVIGEDQERDDTRVFRIDRIVGHVTVR